MCFVRKQSQAARPTSTHETAECLGPISHVISISIEIFQLILVRSILIMCPTPLWVSVIRPHGCHYCAALRASRVGSGAWLFAHACCGFSRSSGLLSTEVTVMAPLRVPKGELRLCAHLCVFPFLLTSSHLERRF